MGNISCQNFKTFQLLSGERSVLRALDICDVDARADVAGENSVR